MSMTSNNKSLFTTIFPAIAISIGLSVALSSRNVTQAAFVSSEIWAGESSSLSTLLLQIFTLTILAICLGRICNFLLTKDHFLNGALPLFYAFLGFFVSTALLNNVFGSRPAFDYHCIYSLIVMTAAFIETNKSVEMAINAAKLGILALVGASCIAAIFMPDIAIQQGYEGILPIDIRLWGLASHPNSLGPLSLLLLLLLIHQPFKMRWGQLGAILLSVGTLLLSQSKTAILAAFITIGIMGFYQSQFQLTFRFRLILLGLLALGLSVVFVSIMTPGAGELFSQWAVTEKGAETLTLTGRNQVWEVAVSEWLKNPLFGYGSSLWGDMRNRYDMDFAFSAHNQFLQSLAGAGIFGLLSLLVYLLLMMRFTFHAAEKTRGLSLALFVMLFIRCITETPLEFGTLFNGDFLFQLLFIYILASFGVYSDLPIVNSANNFTSETEIS
jgi:O-antigen ligase